MSQRQDLLIKFCKHKKGQTYEVTGCLQSTAHSLKPAETAAEKLAELTQNMLLQHSANHLETDALQLLSDLSQQNRKLGRVHLHFNYSKMVQDVN